jgi:hypothetical protein
MNSAASGLPTSSYSCSYSLGLDQKGLGLDLGLDQKGPLSVS